MTPALDDVRVITLQDDVGLRLKLLDWGATWWSLQLPVPGEDAPRELLLGGATPKDHLGNTAYFGATIGRVANRIAGANIERNGQTWPLTPQPGSRHQLHGGPDGFDRRRWTVVSCAAQQALFRLHSPDGDQGYPGAVDAQVQVTLPGGGVVELDFTASTSAPTPVSLTNHAYFNLDGMASDVRHHWLAIAAAQMLPVDDELIPTGPLIPVAGSVYDFRSAHMMGDRAQGVYDHAFLLGPSRQTPDPGLRPAATLTAADERVLLQIDTTLPALQLYTGAHLGRETGRNGLAMRAHAGVALEPQFLPDSPHHPEWPQPSCWLEPGQRWTHSIRYRMSAQ